MIPGQVLECEVLGLGKDLEGVCRIDGQVLFVPFALPGERIKAKVIKAAKSYAFGQLLDILSRHSSHRIPPPCPVFGRCGGCQAQHMDYGLQLESKREQVEGCLQKIGKLPLEVSKPISLQSPWRYRNKLTIPIKKTAAGFRAGFFAPNSNTLIPAQDCIIGSQDAFAAAGLVCSHLDKAQVDQKTDNIPTVHQVVCRTNQRGQSLLVLVSSQQQLPQQEQLITALTNHLPNLIGVVVVKQIPEEDAFNNPEAKILFGSSRLQENISGIDFSISPLSFFQVNHQISQRLLEFVRKHINAGHILGDVYCGAGFFSLCLSDKFSKVVGIEANKSAILDARYNARANGIKNTVFHDGMAEEVLPDLCGQGMKFDAIILDPPRKGAHPEVLKAIAQASPRQLVYISCHPASQARDAAILHGLGYQAVLSQPFDMFCQTSQVENVLVFHQNS